MYKVIETSEGRITATETRTKAEAVKVMRTRAKAAKVWGIRAYIEIEKDGQTIDSRRTYGTKYAR